MAGSISQASVGQLYPNTEVRIEDMDTGETCGPGQLGQVRSVVEHTVT